MYFILSIMTDMPGSQNTEHNFIRGESVRLVISKPNIDVTASCNVNSFMEFNIKLLSSIQLV